MRPDFWSHFVRKAGKLKELLDPEKHIVGGGAKKVLYTLSTLRRIGVGKAAKALGAKNACKACALGMGGQQGGMTNELGEFPSVCNKSVQAQSTDIQPPIPEEIFKHSISELQELTGREMESLGRLNTPLYKAENANHFEPLSWEKAYEIASERLKSTQAERTFFYSSGRSSNEAGFVFQLLARAYGTNNVNNCSYYCHQATGVGLASTIGTGTSTVELADLTGADMIFVIGANPSSNHPRFIHMLRDCRARGGRVVVINPSREPGLVRFAAPKSARSMISGGDEIASDYLQPRIGEDLALLKGLAKAVLERGDANASFIERYTTGFDDWTADIKATSWEEIEQRTDINRKQIEDIADKYTRAENVVFAWGMGVTHHVHGVENVEAIANLALLRGMIGRPCSGLLPLRGHSNVQGIGTIGVKPVLADDILQKIEAHYGLNLPRKPGMDTLSCLRTAHDGNIDAAVIMGGNLLEASPDTAWADKAMSAIGFKLFLTTTLNRGHVRGLDNSEAMILPVTARDEEWEPTTQESMFNFIRLSDGGINRLDNVRPETHILSHLAEQTLVDVDLDFSRFRQHGDIRQAIAQIVPGMQDLATIEVAKEEFHIRNRILHEPHFNTSSGKAEFRVTPLSKPMSEPDSDRHMFRLATVRSEGQFNSIIYEEADSYRRNAPRWSVLMNATDMKMLGIGDGDRVTLKSETGAMKDVVALAFDLPTSSILAYFPEANVLADDAHDPRSMTPAFKSIPVWVETGM